ncbi:MAG TPA: FMN-binding glutamate synthase family protein [Gammaproteobacteria bacterium]|nr:FMN-binding glutamate synthase family protein [Gammaproteobacteria bacterium]HBF07374.1 FMN-binding glutamate synthase family protein [Gammaproteobacteria bacterium]HCK92250.1 FMN-binding glutamate synthase family protein [Gammaproteobacteria bacterium]
MAKRCIAPLAALVLLLASLVYGWFWWGLIAAALVALAAYDWFQTEYSITRNYPVVGRIRWLFLQLRPYLRAYIVEDDLHGTPYSFEARNLISHRAQGKNDTKPFGTERNTDDEEYNWVCHSMAAEAHPDPSPRVTVGNEQTSKPYDASLFNISAMSFGSLSANAVEALNIAAREGGFYHDTGEGGISEYHLKHGGDLVWELGSGYFGARDKHGRFDPASFKDKATSDQVVMTEIKLSQGAKPGHGGMLPGAKVTQEIARVRQVPPFEDCLSPRSHSAFSTPIEMLEFAAQMRDLAGGKPVGLKLCVGQPHEVFALMKAMLETEIYPEYIVVDGGEGGTGAAPLEFSDWMGMPLLDGLIIMRNALVGTGLKSRIRLAASGKVYSGMGLAKNLAIGADWCNAARAFMMSIGCVQAQRCHTGTCPTGVATQDMWRQRSIIPQVQGERAARFHRKTMDSLVEMVAAAGFKHPGELQPHHFMHRIGSEQAHSLDRIHAFLPEGILLNSPEDTLYSDWWAAASADSFKPKFSLELARGRASLA